jgi:hypothetical protein
MALAVEMRPIVILRTQAGVSALRNAFRSESEKCRVIIYVGIVVVVRHVNL